MRTLLLLLTALVTGALGWPQDMPRFRQDQQSDIVDIKNNMDRSGGYELSFETENGIFQSESGRAYPGPEEETGTYVKEGFVEYTLEDGQIVRLNYVADENGFTILNPEELEAMLPTPPPTQYPPPRVPGAGLPVPEPRPEYNPPSLF